jgi:hypothetical protein
MEQFNPSILTPMLTPIYILIPTAILIQIATILIPMFCIRWMTLLLRRRSKMT